MIHSITVKFIYPVDDSDTASSPHPHTQLSAEQLLAVIRGAYGQESRVEVVMIEADES